MGLYVYTPSCWIDEIQPLIVFPITNECFYRMHTHTGPCRRPFGSISVFLPETSVLCSRESDRSLTKRVHYGETVPLFLDGVQVFILVACIHLLHTWRYQWLSRSDHDCDHDTLSKHTHKIYPFQIIMFFMCDGEHIKCHCKEIRGIPDDLNKVKVKLCTNP